MIGHLSRAPSILCRSNVCFMHGSHQEFTSDSSRGIARAGIGRNFKLDLPKIPSPLGEFQKCRRATWTG
jgi:hypothetical protein